MDWKSVSWNRENGSFCALIGSVFAYQIQLYDQFVVAECCCSSTRPLMNGANKSRLALPPVAPLCHRLLNSFEYLSYMPSRGIGWQLPNQPKKTHTCRIRAEREKKLSLLVCGAFFLSLLLKTIEIRLIHSIYTKLLAKSIAMMLYLYWTR